MQLPPGLDLLLADVDAGSNTPSLVSKVLSWRKEKPEWANQLYNVIAASNQNLADSLLRLRILHASDAATYEKQINAAAKQLSPEWDATLKQLPQAAEQGHDDADASAVDLSVTPRTVLQALALRTIPPTTMASTAFLIIAIFLSSRPAHDAQT